MTFNTTAEEQYWTNRYQEGNTGWDIGQPSTPIKAYIDQLKNKYLEILIPGAGNGHEVEYLHHQGFTQTTILDISSAPLDAFKARVPSFPRSHMVNKNFFEHIGTYDLVIEQTFFCSFLPTKENRVTYAETMSSIIRPGGKLVGLWFDFPVESRDARPFGGSREEYTDYLSPYFEVKTFDRSYNSIEPRDGKELFGIFVRK